MKKRYKKILAVLLPVLAAAGIAAGLASIIRAGSDLGQGLWSGRTDRFYADKGLWRPDYEVERDGVLAEETIELPGVNGEYTFLFITDAHIVVTDGTEAPEESSLAANRMDMFYHNGNSAEDWFKGWMDYAARRKPDGVLLAGDIIDFPSAANLRCLDDCLEGLNCPYLYTLGNHDWTYPWEYMSETGKKEYLPLLAPYMQGNTDFHMLDCGEFLIAAADNSSGQFTESAARGIEAACGMNKPVILLVHVPLLTQSVLIKAREAWDSSTVLGGGNYGGIYPSDISQRVIDLVTAQDSPVKAVLAGHVHLADTGTIEGSDGVTQIVGDAGFKGSATLVHVRGRK